MLLPYIDNPRQFSAIVSTQCQLKVEDNINKIILTDTAVLFTVVFYPQAVVRVGTSITVVGVTVGDPVLALWGRGGDSYSKKQHFTSRFSVCFMF